MNERIEELLLTSGVNDNWNEADWYSLSPTMMEKFAELIIRECGTVLDNNYPPYDLVPIEEVMACLKEHFGVKE
jgi:hypothetical protein